MAKLEEVTYPPSDMLNPAMGKIDYEYLILWMLYNNESCTWADLKEEISGSTLHSYLARLLKKNMIERPERNQYKITPQGRNQFNEITYDRKLGKRKLKYPPKPILKRRRYNHWILWTLYNNRSCKWSDFKQEPLMINQSSLSKNLNSLMDNGFVVRDNKEYRITSNGKIEFFNILKSYNLDRQSILEQESKRIEEITEKTSVIFRRFNIQDFELKFRYINLVLKLNYSKVESTLKNEEDFNKILLFLTLNHPDQYPEYISPENFSTKYKIDIETLNYYLLETVEKQFFQIKFFKIVDESERIYYFQKNESLEKLLNAVVEKYITKYTYMNKFQDIHTIDIELLLDNILSDICGNLFNDKLKIPLKQFLPEYIKYLAYKIETNTKLSENDSKLDSFMWHNIFEEFQTFQLSTPSIKSGGIEENYYSLDQEIFDVLEIFYLSKLHFLKTIEAQEVYDIKKFEIVRSVIKLLYNDKVSKARDLYRKNDQDLTELYQLILNDIITTAEINFNESLKITAEIIEKYPDEFIGYLFQSITYLLLDEYENSLKIIETGLKKAPNILLFCQKVQISIKLHRGEKIHSDIDRAISNQPQCVPLLRIKCLLYITHWRDYAKSLGSPIEAINSAINLRPKDKELIVLKSISLLLMNKSKEGKKFLIKEIDFNIFKLNPKIDLSTFFLLTFSYTSRGKYDKALKIANQVLDIYPNHPISYITKALVVGYNLVYKFKLYKSKIETFIKLIDNAIILEPLKYNKVRFLLLKTNILHGIKQNEEAINTINTAIELIPGLFTLHRKKIYILMTERRGEEVLELIEKLIEEYPELKEILYKHKVLLLYSLERYDEGFKANEELIKLSPNNLYHLNNKSMFLGYLGRKEEAIETIEYILKLNPNHGTYYDTYGEIYFIFGEYENAINKFKETLKVDPQGELNFHTCSRLGMCYQKLENYEKALEYFEKGKELKEKVPPAMRELYLHETKKYILELQNQMNKSIGNNNNRD